MDPVGAHSHVNIIRVIWQSGSSASRPYMLQPLHLQSTWPGHYLGLDPVWVPEPFHHSGGLLLQPLKSQQRHS